MAVPYAGSGSIGALIRLIEQEKSKAPTAMKPEMELGAPIREMTAQPFMAPESVGTARTLSLKPEGVPSSMIAGGGQVTPAAAPPTPAAPIGVPVVGPSIGMPERTPSSAGPASSPTPQPGPAPAPMMPVSPGQSPRGVSVGETMPLPAQAMTPPGQSVGPTPSRQNFTPQPVRMGPPALGGAVEQKANQIKQQAQQSLFSLFQKLKPAMGVAGTIGKSFLKSLAQRLILVTDINKLRPGYNRNAQQI